ncbi:nuclear transport factor 2 family protein [Algiphilus sp.]|uniref:nuclear transport factor 2 family protein n=1 Tax=Algiphilus sp. TaxID=1872431 RepID=UPI001CA68B2D|nr:nuclear transport factor 2 family protein [Algiphilus sp.]MBY8964817.1 nuclear transport factor 2 family protein [Algiphilus acroporae]MCI5103960.1 nuclear transport factor 2 family protein [Algiphilus sp.]
MTGREVADKLVEFCRSGETDKGLVTLYAEDAVSVEAVQGPGAERRETKGRDAIKGKHDWWYSAMEEHDSTVDGPYMHGDDRFAVIFEMDVTDRASGERTQMKEVGVYTVVDGKIVREEFFYTM